MSSNLLQSSPLLGQSHMQQGCFEQHTVPVFSTHPIQSKSAGLKGESFSAAAGSTCSVKHASSLIPSASAEGVL